MPPRFVIVLIVVGWAASMTWMGYREWWVWVQPGSPPRVPFTLVDEAVSQGAVWRLLRNDQEIGRVSSRIIYRSNNTFELQSTVQKLTLATLGNQRIEVQGISNAQEFTAAGEPIGFRSHMKLLIEGFPIITDLHGKIRDNMLHAHCTAEAGPFIEEADLDPIPMPPGLSFDPTLPLPKLSVTPGQQWTTTLFNPVEVAAFASLKQLAPRLSKQLLGTDLSSLISLLLTKKGEPKPLRAKVRANSEDYLGQPCFIIDYRADDIIGTVWVRVEDGKVLRQDAQRGGETVSLVREL